MADFGDLGTEADVDSATDPQTTGQGPVLRGGLLNPSTFPSIPPNGVAPQPSILSGPLDPDVHAEVIQDILDAQSQLPPLAPAQSSGDPTKWGGEWLDPPAPQISGPLDTNTHAEALRDIQNAQAKLPGVSPRSVHTFGKGVASSTSNGSTASTIPITYQFPFSNSGAGQLPSLFSTSGGPVQLPKFMADPGAQLRTDGPALVQRDGQSYIWVETPTGTRLVPYVTMSAGAPSNGPSPADRLGLQIMNPVSAILSTGAGLAGAKQSTQDAILLGGSAFEMPLYAAGSIGLSNPARAAEGVAATRPIRAGEITTHQDLVDRSVVGDNLEGHELWQHANLRAHGLATGRLSTPASQNNPVIALDRSVHQQVNAAQKAFDATAQTPIENINANAQILRDLGAVSESDIARLHQMAIKHANRNGY
jgi:hypothetical protein